MKGYQEITHSGKKIILIDLSQSKPGEVVTIIGEAQNRIAVKPAKSVLVLTDVSDASYSKETSDAIKGFAAKNSPFVRASAVVGADGLRAVLVNAVAALTGREIKTFKTREDGLNWLATR